MVNSWSSGTRKQKQIIVTFSGCQRKLDAIVTLSGGRNVLYFALTLRE